ncbi:MAG: serine protease inhibitor [Eggerthellaceae bacterium]|nr:serine protease inhibitor [Eggerthellaceae bacterium]
MRHPSAPRAATRAAACALCAALTLGVAGCASSPAEPSAPPASDEAPAAAQPVSLTEGMTPDEVAPATDLTEAQADALADFSLLLFNTAYDGQGGAVMSPLSVEYALAMTANGARGDTLAQMEYALGLPVSDLNECLHSYAASLEQGGVIRAGSPDDDADADDGDGDTLRLADSLWLREGLAVEDAFLQACVNWYDAGVFEEPFDASTADAINGWVSEHTDGMIDRIVDAVGPQAMLYLVNAVAFTGEWEVPYDDASVADATFTCGDGTTQTLPFMVSEEGLYLEGAGATGFLKPYADGRYSFAALLPAEGTTPAELLASMSGSELRGMLRGASFDTVTAIMPKFEDSFGAELSGPLATLGMAAAFDPAVADFSGICADGGLCIDEVQHRAYIAVDEAGTRAAAATSVGVRAMSAMPTDEPKEVRLDRPFAYLIVDNVQCVPVFVGIMDGAA